MQLKFGTSRIVLLLPSLGVAMKFPRARLFLTVSMLWEILLDPDYRLLGKRLAMFTKAPHGHGESYGLLFFLLGGWDDNRSEYRFWRQSKNPFAWPTIFSLWGVVNVQRLAVQPRRDWEDVLEDMIDVVGRDIRKDPHCFEMSENFCEDSNGRLYLLDYASAGSQFVLQEHGRTLRERL